MPEEARRRGSAQPGRSRREPPQVYRRRRLAALLAALVVATLAVLSLGRLGSDSADGESAAAGDRGRSTTANADTADVDQPVRPDPPAEPAAGGRPPADPAAEGTPARAGTPTAATPADPPAAPSSSSRNEAARADAREIAPVEVPASASGDLEVVPLELPPNIDEGRRVRYAVEVEDGLPFDAAEFARTVHAILGRSRGWQEVEGVAFQLVKGGDVDITVTLASPAMTDELCAPLQTMGQVSCWNGERAVINAKRWGQGASTYGSDIRNYRGYLIAHEVGHGLDKGHVDCPRRGAPAPVMVQQTKSLQGCKANPYPAVG